MSGHDSGALCSKSTLLTNNWALSDLNNSLSGGERMQIIEENMQIACEADEGVFSQNACANL